MKLDGKFVKLADCIECLIEENAGFIHASQSYYSIMQCIEEPKTFLLHDFLEMARKAYNDADHIEYDEVEKKND
jgi:hypothetical protein